MGSSVKLQKIEDELKALKVIQPLNGGALTKDGATATWSGVFDKNNPISDFSLLAAFRATYTRTDGIDKPPLVQFSFSISPDGNDFGSGGMVFTMGTNSVSYRICLFNTWWPFGAATTGSATLTCTAYSTVPGTLILERVYS